MQLQRSLALATVSVYAKLSKRQSAPANEIIAMLYL